MREVFYRRFEASLTRTGARVVAWGVAPAVLAVVAFGVSLAALPLIAREYYAAGFAIFLLGRLVNVLAVTADDGAGRSAAAPPIVVLDCIVYAGVPFAFALADPTRALAASFLLFGFVAVSSASEKNVRNLDALICIAAFAIVCFAPAWFGTIAYGLGIACFAVTGLRLAWRAA
jgi:hypothetical protein